ncbi:MAG: DNA repair ATPase, partial [Aureliella sp.]
MTTEAIQASTYEVLRKRLRDGADELRRRFGQLNAERSKVFGNLDTRLLATVHVTTEHNCVPRDLISVGSHLLLGYNVQFGLKTEIAPSDVFSLYRLEGEQATEEPLTLWMDDRFQRDFSELMRYYKQATFGCFFQNGPLFYIVFQVGKTAKDIKAFKWAIDGHAVRYLDNRSEQEIRYPEQHSFRWTRATREQHRSGLHPHVSIGDTVFVECVGGDLTIKIEDNTSTGSGIYSEPVDDPDQTLDDAEIYHCILGNLVLLKIRPYQEKEFRHFIYSVKRRQAMRLDAMKQACTELPDDHGIIFPGGVFLQTGNYKLFDHGLTDVQFQRTIAAPNGEDYLYQFFQPESGTYLHLRYNLIRQDVDIPLFCHGQSFFDDGRMITMRVQDTPQKHHALQLWQTPFVGPDFKAPVVAESMLYKIGNRDLVRCMSECQEILQLVDKDESYGDLYVDIVKRASSVLDGYFWIDRDETYQLSVPLTTIRDAAAAAVDEYEKVVRVRNETAAALAQSQTATAELLRAAERSRFESIADFVTLLRDLRAQRGHAVGLRELRYIDTDAVAQLEAQLESAAERIGQRCVQFLLSETALEPYRRRIVEASAKVPHVSVVAAGRELQKELGDIAVDLELLVETVSQLKIDDLTQRTAIVDRTGDLLSELNRARSGLKARLRSLLSTEMEADFASQSKLLDQSSAGLLDAADQPEKVDEALSRMMVHIEELEGRFAEHDGLLERLNEKREALIAAFEARRQQLVEIRSRRADGLVKAAERVLTGVGARATRIEEADALRAFFAADPMVDKVRKIADQLGQLGDSVRMEDVLSRLKTLADDALRQQRDRHELFVDGADRIRLGQHVFAVNQQAVELTTVARDGGLYLHLTGTQFYSPLNAPVLEQARDLWLQTYASESDTVYRAETLAFQTLESWRRGEAVADWLPADFRQATPEQRVAWLRQWMQNLHAGGYSRGVHDSDAVNLLDHLLKLQSSLGLLRYSPATRAVAWYAWQRLVPDDRREATEKWLGSYGTVAKLVGSDHRTEVYRRQVAEHLAEHGGDFVRQVRQKEAAEYVFEQILSGSPQPVVSPRAASALKSLRNHFSESARTAIQTSLAPHRDNPWHLWQLGVSIVDASLATLKRDAHEELDPIADYRLELARLIVSHDDPFTIEPQPARGGGRSDRAAKAKEKETAKETGGYRPLADRSNADKGALDGQGGEAACYVTGLHGDHPRIAGGKLRLNYYDFTQRLTHHTQRVMPRFEALQAKKRELLHASEQALRTHEFKARVLTSFVRNRLIDDVYLPLVGENLAKQLGAAGENKRTDRMGLLLLISPPGYGKTTLMEYIANRLGLVF